MGIFAVASIFVIALLCSAKKDDSEVATRSSPSPPPPPVNPGAVAGFTWATGEATKSVLQTFDDVERGHGLF